MASKSWVPEEILSNSCISAAEKRSLLRKYGITELHWACLTNSIESAGDLINRGANVHQVTDLRHPSNLRSFKEIQGVTPLFLAARAGHATLVEMLLENDAIGDILKSGSTGDTALHAAALSGDVDVMTLLLRAHAEIRSRGTDGVDQKGCNERTPLHYAAGGGHDAIVAALIKAGADVFTRDKNGAIPFDFAAAWGNSIPCMQLLSKGLQDVDQARDVNGWTALHYAARNGQRSTVDWLLHQGASVHITAVESHHLNTPLHFAVRHPDVISSLIASGADIWLENNQGNSAIELSHNHKDTLAVKAHIKALRECRKEVDPSAKHGKDGATLLHYVSAYGTADDMAWILGLPTFKEEEINGTPDNAGRTAVHWAAMHVNVSTLHILAKHKADLSAVDGGGRSILNLAIAYNRDHIGFVHACIELPLGKLQTQKWVTHDQAARWMKEHYINHNLHSFVQELQNKQAIEQSSLRRVSDTFRVFFRQMASTCMAFKEARSAANCNSVAYDILDDVPPIYLALHAGLEDIAKFMKEHIKEDEVVNRTGKVTKRTALHWAAILGKAEIVSKLSSSKPNLEDTYGKTPLQYAKEMNQVAVEKKLMEREEVRFHLDVLYRDRQVFVDATNALLVVAALIASVTFAGWLQPPLSYVTYYDLPPPAGAPDGAYASYVAVQQHMGVSWWWVFNSLSFTFAIATVLAGLWGVVPKQTRHITTTVVRLRWTLQVASAMLAMSTVCVLGAFAAAGFSVLPPILQYQVKMMSPIILGGILCMLLLAAILSTAARKRTPQSESQSARAVPPPPPKPPLRFDPRPWETDDLVSQEEKIKETRLQNACQCICKVFLHFKIRMKYKLK